ncbi:MAG: alpha/beta fold hydrolase [Burkholderiaceae bacterium]
MTVIKPAASSALELAYEQFGDGSPVVVLHGLFGSSTNWRRIARALSDRHRVFTVDLRNHGNSPWAATMAYAEMAEDVVALFDRLDLQKPDVLGHSMGGKVAMTLALTGPQRLGRLVVVDIAPISYGDHFSSYTQAMRGIDTVAATSRDEVQRALSQDIHDPGTVGFLMQNLVRHNEQYDWRINLPALSAAMTEIGAFPSALDGKTFSGPTTLITAARSDYVSADDRKLFSNYFPKARFVEIRDAGHWVHVDRPDEFIVAVREALGDPASMENSAKP